MVSIPKPARLLPSIAAFLLLFGLAGAPSASAARFGGVEEPTLSTSIQYFTWEEFDGGQRLLRESGPLYGFGGGTGVGLLRTDRGTLLLDTRGELFGGVVGYDGQTQQGAPVDTDVVYFGLRAEGDVGWRFEAARASFEPFAGLGYRWWRRDLQNSTTSQNGTTLPVSGYLEQWRTAYLKLGLRGGYRYSDTVRMFVEAGARYPFATANDVDFPGLGRLTVRPGGLWTAFAEGGIRYGRFRPSVFYEGLRFSASPVVSGVLQPDSSSDIIGVRLGWVFH